jgi:DCN1-like protein 1/2
MEDFTRLAALDGSTDEILDEGISALCSELGIDPMGIEILVAVHAMGCARMCVISRAEWLKGLRAAGAGSVKALRSELPGLTARTLSQQTPAFREFYEFVFDFGRDEGQRSLAKPVAIALWGIVLDGRFASLGQWVAFVEQHKTLAISRDTWMQTLEFARATKGGLDGYDENGAWPVIIDEFVEHLRESS